MDRLDPTISICSTSDRWHLGSSTGAAVSLWPEMKNWTSPIQLLVREDSQLIEKTPTLTSFKAGAGQKLLPVVVATLKSLLSAALLIMGRILAQCLSLKQVIDQNSNSIHHRLFNFIFS